MHCLTCLPGDGACHKLLSGLPLALIITTVMTITAPTIINSLQVSPRVQETWASASTTALPDQKRFPRTTQEIVLVKVPAAPL